MSQAEGAEGTAWAWATGQERAHVFEEGRELSVAAGLHGREGYKRFKRRAGQVLVCHPAGVGFSARTGRPR